MGARKDAQQRTGAHEGDTQAETEKKIKEDGLSHSEETCKTSNYRPRSKSLVK